MKGGGDVNEIV